MCVGRDPLWATLGDILGPLPESLALVGCRFDPLAGHASDFARAGVAAPPALARAVGPRRAEFLAGRLCARAALKTLGMAGDVKMGNDRAPRWPEGSLGAISHTRAHALALVGHAARWQGLGADLEGLIPADRVAELLACFTVPEERWLVRPAHAAMLATAIFSLKESLFKALYPAVRLPLDFTDLQVHSLGPGGRACLCLRRQYGQWPAGRLFTAHWHMLEDGFHGFNGIASVCLIAA